MGRVKDSISILMCFLNLSPFSYVPFSACPALLIHLLIIARKSSFETFSGFITS